MGGSAVPATRRPTQTPCPPVQVDAGAVTDADAFASFLTNPVHDALAACSSLRPPVDISVGGDADGSDVGVGAGGARTEFSSVAAPASA